MKRSKIRVILGDHDQYVTTEAVAVMRAVSAVIRHRNFDMDSYNHDVALLKLRKPVKFTKSIKPICLPTAGWYSESVTKTQRDPSTFSSIFINFNLVFIYPGSDPAGKEGTVVGWGRTSEGGTLASVPHEVKVPILSLQQCRQMKYRANRITNNMICAGRGSQDSCQGDSGGPLLVQAGDKLELAGKHVTTVNF